MNAKSENKLGIGWLSISRFFAFLLFTACSPDLPTEISTIYNQLPETIDFNTHVKPILSDKCFACHGPDKAKAKAGLQLHKSSMAFKELSKSSNKRAITPGNLRQSKLFHRIISTNPNLQMPPPDFNVELTAQEKAILIKWIQDGAQYQPHWAFIKPKKPKLPKIKDQTIALNPIDHFIISKLEELDLTPSTKASKELLLRRLSLDLTGLPPTQKEIQAFLADHSDEAYEKQVDRLLASKHYGEQMSTDWMDVARYSDTYGYQVDRYRDMSPWRDWVIQSFNENMPYDQFLVWQLAGDLLPHATKEQILATAFNRLHPLNMEDGIIDEEFRVENVSDRVAVLGDGLLGLTLSCAKCHDHKYDPISQKEYYELYSFFNNINETGQIAWDKSTPPPTLQLPTQKQEQVLFDLKQKIIAQETKLAAIAESEKLAIKAWIDKGRYSNVFNQLPTNGLLAHYSLESQLTNNQHLNQKPIMKRAFSNKEIPRFTQGYLGMGLQLDGDAWLECREVGIFKRSDPFTIALWVFLPKDLEEGVIFHKNKGSNLHAYRGYHLYLKNNKLEWLMARTWPENAIFEQTTTNIPRNKWIHLTVTYDGSSTAAGTKIFINGKEAPTRIIQDNLTRDIVFNNLEDIIYPEPIEPNLKVGGRWRGVGIKNAKVDEIFVYNRALTKLEIEQILNIPKSNHAPIQPPKLTQEQKIELSDYYLTNVSRAYQMELDQLTRVRTALVDSMEQVQEIMVMDEMKTPRPTYILNRGVYNEYGAEVFANTPQAIMPMPEHLPKNRLGLARWLTHPDHPLTTRVVVNRYWQLYFGRGLVKTAQDFGNQGERPSHPGLLDWLATHFIESGWNVKALQKLIVMSATYQQSSYANEALLEIDPDNVWLARGPALRLTSEMIRDNALAASNLLNTQVGGESVYPYQPAGLWAMNFDPYPQDQGEKLYRRSFYTMWRRTNPNPTLATFDQPERNVCTVKRQKTNTPLQALVLMNDPTFVEASKVMGEKMTQLEKPEKGIEWAFIQLTGRTPNDQELQLLLQLRSLEYENFKSNPQKTKGWLTTGAYAIDPTLDKNKVVANAIVASVIMNGDASIMKR